MADARAGGVGDGRGLRHTDAEHAAARARVTGADADEDADGPRAHQVQCGRVRRAAADDHRDLELTDELLQVERLGGLRDVLRRHDGALDDEDVELALEHVAGVALEGELDILVIQGTVVSAEQDRKSTRLNSSHTVTSYAVFCLKKKKLKSGGCHGCRFVAPVKGTAPRQCFKCIVYIAKLYRPGDT